MSVSTSIATSAGSDSVETLWREFSAPLRRFLRARTRTPEDAEDLLQEVFLRIHRQLPSLRDTSKLQGWIYRIARNAIVDRHRRTQETAPLPEELPADDPSGQSAIDLTPSLRRFIARLPVAYREPLVRHEFQGEPLHDIAADLGLTLTATKSRVRRARLMLREMLDRCCRFEFDRRGRVIEATARRSSDCDCRRSKPTGRVACG